LRQQIEDRIVEFFQTAPQPAVEVMLQVVKGIVNRRATEPRPQGTLQAAQANGRISAATRKKISATLKARNAAQRQQKQALAQLAEPAPTPTPVGNSRPKPSRGAGGGMEPRITMG
jgi:hypothetical protein